ncbi:DNA-binding transcriptional regulator, MerR family [Streptoalloteichus tenebrarius]|uniref:DNA-binding transcriptional regulator, MerR family n=1 Tax=Streptoalloteichus tenebrarius (strain ATCC 17920 / DSM 40477 / JCM 4838 / CBS 697.72 / NBRC 16177 / NCIMB 11028 / NRRL B-12390 / A12253. 1 / ISP 5477) TaxID=1933 RepID=A0ABT1HLI4_STRSD|nr:MerR family transcriptional regulator [Streptoalloteichus tenebrarius]MCP2256376.1 DNA-binding transcriptional regulator, MerR family [Streptoalloteichus tenebrarius]BFF04718.1 hypothetical protein GCM10020241_63930 [Streptoalloteichus tenebrarius]
MNAREADRGIQLDIGELAELARVQPSALRFYERQGLLRPSGRAGGRRIFDEDGLRQLAAIDFWREAGFTIEEIAGLVGDPTASMDEAKRVAASRLAELDQIIERATQAKRSLTHILSCAHPTLAECPYYREHLEERVNKIISGGYQRDHQTPLQQLRRAKGSSAS